MADKKKIAFIVGLFPAVSETWMITQVAGLLDRGFEVEIFSFNKGNRSKVSDLFTKYELGKKTRWIGVPENKLIRLLLAIPKAIRLLVINPPALGRVFNFKRYGRWGLSLELLFWSEPFVGRKFDLYHCHSGQIGNRFLDIRYVADLGNTFLTSFYGQDVSSAFARRGDNIYEELKEICPHFIVMSEVMKQRIVSRGFDDKKISVIPIFGVDVNNYPFSERTVNTGGTIQICTVGRLVEKKGYDDLLRALEIVKTKTDKKFHCDIIGDGPLNENLQNLSHELGLDREVTFRGFMKLEDIVTLFKDMHIYLQPSKTATNGDAE